MKNRVNNFGYLVEGDIRRKLVFPQVLRGCNRPDLDELFKLDFVPDDILQALPKIPFEKLESGLNSFTFQRLTSSNNEAIEKYAYLFLIMNDLGEQIKTCLVKNNICMISFENYENTDYDNNSVLIDFLGDILRFRGYYVEKENNGLLVVNCNSRITREQLIRVLESVDENAVRIYVEDKLDCKEELIYRAISEILNVCPRYNNLTAIWMKCKESLCNLSNIDFGDLHNIAYKAYYVYCCLNSYENLDTDDLLENKESNIIKLTNSIQLDDYKEMEQLGTDLIDTDCVLDLDKTLYNKELGIARDILEESLENAEKIIDSYYTPDLKPIRCTRLLDKDLKLFSYEALRTSLSVTEPISIPKKNITNNIEEIEPAEEIKGKERPVVNNSGNRGFKRYLPIIAVTIVVLIAARILTL